LQIIISQVAFDDIFVSSFPAIFALFSLLPILLLYLVAVPVFVIHGSSLTHFIWWPTFLLLHLHVSLVRLFTFLLM